MAAPIPPVAGTLRLALTALLGASLILGATPLWAEEPELSPEDNIWVGVDIGHGPEETPVYIQVGHAW